jgi:hypothetical protein
LTLCCGVSAKIEPTGDNQAFPDDSPAVASRLA